MYAKSWNQFKEYFQADELETQAPSETQLLSYFKHMRVEKNRASSSLWTLYSMPNSIIQAKYPRVETYLKFFYGDIKTKAKIFDKEDLVLFIENEMLDDAFWLDFFDFMISVKWLLDRHLKKYAFFPQSFQNILAASGISLGS